MRLIRSCSKRYCTRHLRKEGFCANFESSALSELDGVDPMLTIQLTALNRRAIRLYQAIELMLLSLLIRLIFQRRNIYHDCERHRLW